MRTKSIVFFALAAGFASAAFAEILDRSDGLRIGQRMTLRPYVALSLGYDSNVGSRHDGDGDGDGMWTISPGLGLSYDAESWSLLLTGYYNYHQYFKSENSYYNRHSYGEDLRWNWSNSTGAEKGWSLILGQSFQQINAADDMMATDGRGVDTDSRQLQLSGALQRRFNERWHGNVNASYYWLDYQNDTRYTGSLYGWERLSIGAEAGFAPSRWTDIILAGGYQDYSQDNAEGSRYVGSDSYGWTLQGGLGSYMTERISYRLLAGWSRFEYGGGASASDGFVYTASGNWKIGETWNTMLLATSYYQPSERQYSSKSRVDAISWGLAKVMVRGKLRLTLDLRYRRETNEYAGSETGSDYDYTLDIFTGRLGGDYSLCRFLSLFLYGEYQKSLNSECDARQGAYDYDRWRIVGGVRLSY